MSPSMSKDQNPRAFPNGYKNRIGVSTKGRAERVGESYGSMERRRDEAAKKTHEYVPVARVAIMNGKQLLVDSPILADIHER